MCASTGSGRGGERIRVLCLLPRMNDSRIARRIDMLREYGFDVEALAFEREQDRGRAPACPVGSLGYLDHGRYALRIPKLLLSASNVRKAARRNDLVYAFNCDLALLALVATAGLGAPVALETADIRDIQVSMGWRGSLVRAVERLVTERCRLLVVTAAGYRAYYHDWLGSRWRPLVVENKMQTSYAQSVERAVTGMNLSADSDRPIRIGWFGMLRDEWTWRILEKVIAEEPARFAVLLAGVGMLEDFAGRVLKRPDVQYLGEYEHPEGLTSIYDAVDLVMACYSTNIPGSWSRSNRYYEACLFNRPLVVRAGCADAEPVYRHDIGLVIDTPDIDEAAAAIRSITAWDLRVWSANMASLPKSEYSVTDETAVLGRAVAAISAAGVSADG